MFWFENSDFPSAILHYPSLGVSHVAILHLVNDEISNSHTTNLDRQKQPPELCYINRCSQNFLQNSQENTWAKVSFLIKLQASDLIKNPSGFIKKKTLAQVFSCEFCEIFKSTFFTEHLREQEPTEKIIWNGLSKWIIFKSRQNPSKIVCAIQV